MLPSVPLHPTKALGPRLQPDRQQLQQHSALQYSQFAVCLKSGADTLHVRVPTQLATFLRAIPNLLIISDASDEIEGHVVHDVVTGLYDRVRARLGLLPIPTKTVNAPKKAKASENTAGWRADAHKNIPGFELLYETFPDASWYFMIDDDTYVDFKNLADLVKTLDPDVPYFTGRRNIFAGCDGVKKFGDGPFFVQGGSGILLSRAAMRLVYGGMSACILRYETCWAGDVRTALCMRDAGVLASLNVGFFGTGLHEEVPYTDDPCMRPFTFHHNNSTAIERLFRLSQTQEGLTMASAHQEFVDTQTTIDVGYDRKGGRFKSIDGLDAAQCQGVCQLEPQCASWVLTNAGLCELKKTPGFVFAHANFTSGGIAGRYRCLQSQHQTPTDVDAADRRQRILSWAQRALTYYVKVGIVAKVTDFNRSWQNGVGLLCLIHLVDPNLVPDIAAMSSWLAAPHTVKTFDVNAYLAVLKDLRIVYSADQRQWQSTCDRALRLCANESVGVSPAFGLNSTSLASLTADENDVVDLIEQFQRRLGFSDLPGGKTEELSDLSNVEDLSEQPKAAPLVEAASIADSNGTFPQQYTQQVVTTVRETTEHSEPVVTGAVKGIKSFWEALTGSHSQPHERPAVVEQKFTGPSSTTKETTVVTVVADSPATADIAPAAALETTVLNDSMGPQVSETSVPPESTITKTITTVVSTVEELPEDPVVVDPLVPSVGVVVQPSGKFPRRTVSFSKSVVPATVETVPTLQINVIPTEQTVTITQTTKDVIVDDALTPKASELPSNRVLPLEVAPAQIAEIEEVQPLLNSEPVAGNETAQQISAQSLPRGLSTTTNTTTTTVTVEEQLPPKSPSLVSTILSGARSYAEVLKNAAEKSVEVVETAVTDAIEKFNEPKHHEEVVVQISEAKPVKTASDAPSAIIPMSVDSSSSSEPLVSELSLTANAEPKSNVSKEVIIEEPTPGTSVIRTVTTTTYVTTPDVDYSTPSEITVSERRPSMKFAPRSTSLTAKSSGEFLPESAPVISVAENDPSVFQAVAQEPETIQTITETYPDSTVTKTISTRTVTVVETVNDEESEPLVQDSSLIATPDVLQTSSLPKSEESLQGNPEILSDSKAIVEETETFSSVEPEVVVVKQSPIISQQIIEPAPQVPKKPSTSGFNFMSFVSSVFDKHPAEATVTQEPAFGKRASFVEPAGPSTLAPDYATPVNSQAKRPSTSGFSFKAFVDGIPGFGSGHEHEYSPVATNPVDSDLAFDKVITTEISPANAVPVKPFEISSTEIASRALPLDAEYSNSPITTKKTVTTTVTTMSEPAKPLSVVETISQPVVVEEKIEKESDDTANNSSSTFNFISFIEPTLPSFTFSRDGDQKTEVFLDDKSVPLESNDVLESRARNLTFSNEQVVPAGSPASTVRTIKTTTVVRESVPETVTAGNVSQVMTQAPESSFSFKSVLENSVPDYVDKTAIPTYTFDQVVKETVKAPSLLETINEEQVPPFSAVTTTTEEKETDSPSSKRRNILSDDSNSFSVETSNSTFPETVSKAVEEEKPKKKKFVFTRIKSASSLGSDGKSTPVSESSDYRSTPEIEQVESSEVQATMEKSIAPENVTEIISTENTIAPEIVSKTIEAENSVIPADAAAASQSTKTTTTITTTTVTVNNADGVPETVKTVETVVQKDGDAVVSDTSENRAVTGESTGSSNGVQSSSFSTESQNIGGSEFTKRPVVSVEQESIAETKASNEKANSSVSSKQKEREVVLSETYKSHVLESDEVLRVCEYELTSRFNDYESFNKDDLVAWVKEIKTTSEMFIDVGGQVLNDEWNEHWFAAKYIPPHMNLIERARKIVERLNEFTRTKLSV